MWRVKWCEIDLWVLSYGKPHSTEFDEHSLCRCYSQCMKNSITLLRDLLRKEVAVFINNEYSKSNFFYILTTFICSELSSPTSFSPSVMTPGMSASGIGYGRSLVWNCLVSFKQKLIYPHYCPLPCLGSCFRANFILRNYYEMLFLLSLSKTSRPFLVIMWWFCSWCWCSVSDLVIEPCVRYEWKIFCWFI